MVHLFWNHGDYSSPVLTPGSSSPTIPSSIVIDVFSFFRSGSCKAGSDILQSLLQPSEGVLNKTARRRLGFFFTRSKPPVARPLGEMGASGFRFFDFETSNCSSFLEVCHETSGRFLWEVSYQRGVYSRCRTGTPDFWKILKMSPWSLQKRRRTLQLFVRDSSYMFETQPDHQIELHTSNQPQSNSFTPLHFRKTSTSTKSLVFLLNTFFPKKKQTHQNTKQTPHFLSHHPHELGVPLPLPPLVGPIRWESPRLPRSARLVQRRGCPARPTRRRPLPRVKQPNREDSPS